MHTRIVNTNEEIMEKLRANYEAQKPIQLLNVFRGIPIVHEGKLILASQGYVVLSVHGYQAVCIVLERRTYLQSDFLPRPVKASPIAVDVAHGEVVLTRFTPAGEMIGQRMSPRVQSKEVMRVQIQTDSGSLTANLADISLSGVGVFTFGALTEDQLALKRNKMVDLNVRLLDGRPPLTIKGKVTNITQDRATMLHRVGVCTYPDDDSTRLLMEYIALRQDEIMHELEMTYQVMCKPKT